MNRRGLFKAVFGASLAAKMLPEPAVAKPTIVRDLGIGGDGWPDEFAAGLRPRTIINGEDVSNRCYRAIVQSDGIVTALLYKWRNGGPYLEGDAVAREGIYGRGSVDFVPDPRRCGWKHKQCVGIVDDEAIIADIPCDCSDPNQRRKHFGVALEDSDSEGMVKVRIG